MPGKNFHATSRPLRIAYCLPTLEPLRQLVNNQPVEASFIQQQYIIAALCTRQHQLTLVAQHNFNQTICTNNLDELQVAPRSWSTHPLFEMSSKIAWRIQQFAGIPYLNLFSNLRHFDACQRCLLGHDLVYEQNSLYSIGAALACQRAHLPYVLFFDADEIMEHRYRGQPLSKLLQWHATGLLKYKLKLAHRIICVSEQTKAHLFTTWQVPKEKIAVFPNAVDVQRFRPDATARAAVRADWGLRDQPIIIFVGNFLEWQDVKTLLQAFAQTLTTRPDAHLILVGDGPTRAAMQQLAVALGIAGAVTFTGLLPHLAIPRLLNAADIAVAPYPHMDQELWHSPMKLFEYMAAGKAIIASNMGQITDILTNNDTGLLVPPGDVAALAAAQQRLISNPDLRKQLGLRAHEVAQQEHDWQHYVLSLEQLFTAVVAESEHISKSSSRTVGSRNQWKSV